MRSALALLLPLVAGVCAITPRNDAQYLRATIAGREYTDQAAADQVKYLPGWGNLQDDETRVFSGYVTVDEEAGRSLFYVFVESQNDPATDPVVLWLNGGPGCSSLGGGFLSELGPFYPTTRGQLEANDYAWNQQASVIFVEAPAFVGFSYSNTSADRIVGDDRTARDNHEFLKRWFDRFPQYRANSFWVSGESYAGHYVPTLAREIIRGNRNVSERPFNFRGLLVGNAWTDAALDNHGALDFWFSHGIISHSVYDGVRAHCNFHRIGPLHSRSRRAMRGTERDTDERLCDAYIDAAMKQLSGINIYDIYADVCIAPASNHRGLALSHALRGVAAGAQAAVFDLQAPVYDPCVDNKVEKYLNRPEVQQALHVHPGLAPKRWSDCTREINYSREDLLSSMIPVWKELLEADLDYLVYSGDVDAIVPVTGTRAWVHGLGLEVHEAWRSWKSSTRQVGGWTVKYEKGLTFASVRGAGHMVPYTQPERALYLFNAFINHQRL